jgi:hypothetical protein
MTAPNGAGGKFDKLTRRDDLQKDDDILRTLRKFAPAVAKTVDDIDMKFADILARLQRIEDAEEAQRAQPSRIMPPREPDPNDVLRAMTAMSPDQRAALMMKLKQ